MNWNGADFGTSREGPERQESFAGVPDCTYCDVSRRFAFIPPAGGLFDLLLRFHPPISSATSIHAARRWSARTRLFKVLATIMPPDRQGRYALRQRAASGRSRRRFPVRLRSRTLTIALNTVSKARRALALLRATSVGSATIGQEFSTSSKCCRDK
jgi:hypothetical protein